MIRHDEIEVLRQDRFHEYAVVQNWAARGGLGPSTRDVQSPGQRVARTRRADLHELGRQALHRGHRREVVHQADTVHFRKRADLGFQVIGHQARGIQSGITAQDGPALGMDSPQYPRRESIGCGERGEAQGQA